MWMLLFERELLRAPPPLSKQLSKPPPSSWMGAGCTADRNPGPRSVCWRCRCAASGWAVGGSGQVPHVPSAAEREDRNVILGITELLNLNIAEMMSSRCRPVVLKLFLLFPPLEGKKCPPPHTHREKTDKISQYVQLESHIKILNVPAAKDYKTLNKGAFTLLQQ